MQVATLFRESANLLGGSSTDTLQTHQIQQHHQQQLQHQSMDYGQHMQHLYKTSNSSPEPSSVQNDGTVNNSGLLVKQEACDDGYETSPDLEIRSYGGNISSLQYHTPLTPHTPHMPHTPKTPLTPISAALHQPQQPSSSATTLGQLEAYLNQP
ncbi:uncharacterized protein LOC106643122 [Copidosoma floridanum]|uniref:uncharacterized protein LOC106643122 n=1 Tax=Copidosoma floridanum TaxID=29053 RepID=UPI0006C962F0|nr:uncharacterized protein LOC106643122 [Copidosoma floridanum]